MTTESLSVCAVACRVIADHKCIEQCATARRGVYCQAKSNPRGGGLIVQPKLRNLAPKTNLGIISGIGDAELGKF